MKEATLVVYRDKLCNTSRRWRGNVIDNRNGLSVFRTEWAASRTQAMLDGAAKALEHGYKVWLAGFNSCVPEPVEVRHSPRH